jgi:RNA polymerase sigma factor (sigma-70 family)
MCSQAATKGVTYSHSCSHCRAIPGLHMHRPIHDSTIKNMIRSFQRGDSRCYNDIVDTLSSYIYNYPRIVWNSDSDRCGDFYEYIFRRFRKIILSYNETEAKFVTWFTVVLRNRYLNFIREMKNRDSEDCDSGTISLDYQYGKSQSLHNVIAEKKNFLSSDCELFDRLVAKVVGNLNPKQRVFFHLYFIDSLRPEDVAFLSLTLNMAVRETMMNVTRLKESVVRKYAKKHAVLEKLNVLHGSLLRVQNEGKLEEIPGLRRRREKLIEEYRRIKIHPSYESLARFMGIPLGTVSTGISRMKSAVREILEE